MILSANTVVKAPKDPTHDNMGAKDYLNATLEGKPPVPERYPLFSDGPDGGKAAFIHKVISHYRQLAKIEMLREFGNVRAEYEDRRHNKPGRFLQDIVPKQIGLP